MGITYLPGTVRGPTGKEAIVRFLVDSGVRNATLRLCAWHLEIVVT